MKKFIYGSVAISSTFLAAISFVGFVGSVYTWDIESAGICGIFLGFYSFVAAVMALALEQ